MESLGGMVSQAGEMIRQHTFVCLPEIVAGPGVYAEGAQVLQALFLDGSYDISAGIGLFGSVFLRSDQETKESVTISSTAVVSSTYDRAMAMKLVRYFV